MMKIGMILQNKFPPDIRVEKEARALLSAGHKVHLLAHRSTEIHEPFEESVDGLLVRRIPGNPPSRWLNSLQFYSTFQNRYWAKQIVQYVHDFQLEALHVHDLPFVKTAVSVGKRYGIPVIADLHENFPAALQVNDEPKGTIKAWLTSNPKRWAAYEQRAVHLATQVVVVVDEAKQRLMRQYGLPSDKITVVMNVEDLDHFKSLDLDPEILARYRDLFVISYIGGGGKHRGLYTAIGAMAHLRDAIPQGRFVIVGPSDTEVEQYRAAAEAQGVNDRVELIGWQPFHKVPSYIQASKICLVPHHQNPHTDATVPHKLFQYMLMGKPVVVSSCRPLRRLVEEIGSGLVFNSGDSHDLARQILTLYANPGLQQDCGRRGHEAVINRYNWAMEGEKLCFLYNALSKNLGKVNSY